MKEQLQKTVEIMRKHVLQNLDSIKNNENKIREIINWPASPERTRELNEGYKYSKLLLAENNEFINLQVSIMNLLNKYKEKFEDDDIDNVNTAVKAAKAHKLSREDSYKMTIENIYTFNETHPYFHDDAFFKDLIEYFKKIEKYEVCNELIKLK